MIAPRLQIAFITGRSNPGNCSLSPLQWAFLQRLAGPARLLEPLNFPYGPAAAAFESVGLLRASINNARDYLGSRRSQFRERYRPAVEELLTRAPETLLLAGSCGLELLVNLHLSRLIFDRITVFAFGPVSRSLPPCRCVIVQGRHDWISRRFFRHADHQVEAHHLGYLRDNTVFQCCESVVHSMLSNQTVTA